MADIGIDPVGNGSEWGPRAEEYNRNIVRNADEGPLKSAQVDNPAEVHNIVRRAKPPETGADAFPTRQPVAPWPQQPSHQESGRQGSTSPLLAPRDEVALSPEALSLMD